MRKKILTLAGLGFLLGMAMVTLIFMLFSRTGDGSFRFVSESLVSRTGSVPAATVLQLLLCGLYGALCMGGTLLYEIENWPLARSTLVHYLMIALGYLPPALLLGWSMGAEELLAVEGIMTAGFFLIWLLMYLRFKAQVRELNELLEKQKEDTRDKEKGEKRG